MDTPLIARLKILLRKLWEAWSSIQDREDVVWKSELRAEPRSSSSSSCEATAKTDTPEPSETESLSDLVKQRNEEHDRQG